jgi:DNA polymerase I-like protein with 3'-5' exonuclease and polymerase domains
VEIFDDKRLACCGFATSPSLAYVFDARLWLDSIQELIEEPSLTKVFANGQFDWHQMLTREGITLAGYVDDTQVAWHACYPELAGKSESKDSKTSRKSLAFLDSLFLYDHWWKDYSFANEKERQVLNGRDCCVTLDLMVNHLDPLIDSQDVRDTYEHELSMVPLCVDALERGILIDEDKRQERANLLEDRWQDLSAEINELTLPLLLEAKKDTPPVQDDWHLFEDVWTCPCCRNGGSKRQHCTSCAGVTGTGKSGGITMEDLRAVLHHRHHGKKKAELVAALPACSVCGGEGQRVTIRVNPNSDGQKKILVYYVLGLPKRYNDKILSCAEDKLKAGIAWARSKPAKKWKLAIKVVELLVETQRIKTHRGINKRIAPGDDGCIRTVMNPTGTETGRLSHGSTFMEKSTNLANLPKKTAGLDPLFNARSVMVPRPGQLLGEIDYSQAEARLAAYEARDPLAIKQYQQGVDRYAFFAKHFYGYEISKKSPERQVGKAAILSLQYGVQWKTWMEAVNGDEDLTGASVTAAEAKRAVALFHQLYPRFQAWHEEVWRRSKRNGGFLINRFGRRRDFFGRRGTPSADAAVMREMVAFIPQSTSVDLLNRRMVQLYQQMDPLELRILLQIHDAVLFEMDEVDDPMPTLQKAKDIMEHPVEINGHTVLLPAEVSISAASWAEMKEVL